MKGSRTRLSDSQKKMIAALERAKWENDVCAMDDPYTITSHFEMPDEVWILRMERERFKPLVSVGDTDGHLFMFQEAEELFAFFLRIKLERLAKVAIELKLEALERSLKNS